MSGGCQLRLFGQCRQFRIEQRGPIAVIADQSVPSVKTSCVLGGSVESGEHDSGIVKTLFRGCYAAYQTHIVDSVLGIRDLVENECSIQGRDTRIVIRIGQS